MDDHLYPLREALERQHRTDSKEARADNIRLREQLRLAEDQRDFWRAKLKIHTGESVIENIELQRPDLFPETSRRRLGIDTALGGNGGAA